MSPPSQYQARRLLELVSHNKARLSNKDHVDHDVWARTHPPVRGLNFRDRATAQCCLRAGGLGAVPCTPPELPDAPSRALAPVPSNHNPQQPMPRAESNQSRITVSSVPSFGKMHEPLSGDSVTIDSNCTRPAAVTEYEEFGSEALITQVQDEIDEEFEDSTPSRLFSEIGPSISIAKGIDGNKPKPFVPFDPQQLDNAAEEVLVQPSSRGRDEFEAEEKSVSSAPKSASTAPKTFTSMPSTSTTLPPPPLPPLPAYALEPKNQYESELLGTEVLTSAISVPPPPPPLYMVQNYGSAPTVPPPPSSPPPRTDDKRSRRDTEDSSPVTEGESYDFRAEFRDEFSDLADSSVPSMKAQWYREYAPAGSMLEKNDEHDDEQESFGEEEIESVEDEECGNGVDVDDVHVGVRRNMVGRREGIVG